MPRVARNLSPRIGRLPGCPEVHLLMALNVDQAMEIEKGCTQVNSKGIHAKFPSDRQLRSSTSSQNMFNVLGHD